jgi:leader peptidase (prepilin peptidase) / N-methyltransferase
VISPESFTAFLFFILGACLGSFGNVVIARYPAGESVVRPRSRCPKCKQPIKAHDNIPILSWLMLRGRCRNCEKSISPRYPAVELICGILFAALYLKLGLTVTLAECLIFGWGVVIASFIDLDHRILPDVLTLSGIVVGLLGALVNPDRGFAEALIGVLAGGGFLWLVAYVYSVIRKEEGMGGGDIKLLGWIGAVLGWKSVIFTVLVSCLSGSLVGGIYAATQKSGMKTAIPFGPFLALAAVLYIFIGESVMRSYLALFFPFTE